MTEVRGSTGRHDGSEAVGRAPGTPTWVSLMAHGLATTQEFYGALFGWEFRPGPEQLGPYVRALLDGHEVAGIGQLPPDHHLPIAWTPYLASEDVNATADAVRHCCGTIGVGPLDAGTAGRLAIGVDPAGAVFGIWQAAEHLGGELVGQAGAPAWNELVTTETADVVKFYEAVFGYTEEAVVPSESETETDYVTFQVDGRPVAAVHGVGQDLPRDRGPHWMTYFEVVDVDASVKRVTELGGHVIEAARAGIHGRVATVADPEGAVFALVRSNS
ncbi:VOC family protein [Streptomyces sp. NPDC058257]|uniref:VOC family protein n=1 Tax=Streptomyces sp. NPDC058257 TaxID=3346409 RepID=UPI0036EF0CE9